ncbi:MAG: pyridoxamine 5'-phosphate oxidase family protein [Erysipelotrichaceae bacterium]
MQEVVSFLQDNPVQYLATQGLDGAPQVRPFMFSLEQGGKLWFCTNTTKQVYQELQANPKFSLCVSSPAYAWLRMDGVAVFEDNVAIKQACMENPIVASQYGSANNPIFTVFYIDQASATISDFSGNPPRNYRF